jgi:hypothetical protein
MRTIPLTKGYEAIVDDRDYTWLSLWKWHVSVFCGKPYARRAVWNRETKRSIPISMQREIMNPHDDLVVDHIDGNTLDNRRINLRCCTRKQNGQNKKGHSTKLSKYIGAYKNLHGRKWRASINHKHLGNFATEEDAASAYDRAAIREYGEYARLNFPVSQYPPPQ